MLNGSIFPENKTLFRTDTKFYANSTELPLKNKTKKNKCLACLTDTFVGPLFRKFVHQHTHLKQFFGDVSKGSHTPCHICFSALLILQNLCQFQLSLEYFVVVCMLFWQVFWIINLEVAPLSAGTHY